MISLRWRSGINDGRNDDDSDGMKDEVSSYTYLIKGNDGNTSRTRVKT